MSCRSRFLCMLDKLKFNCICGKPLTADLTAAGKRAKCPNCGQVIQIPQPQKPPATSEYDSLGLAPLDALPRLSATTARPAASTATSDRAQTRPASSPPPMPGGGPPPLP